MNIFAVDHDPVKAARSLCDKHVVKMVLESAQLLCSPFEPGKAPYKRTHYNHPCAVWARSSWYNYDWLLDHAYALIAEYARRYGKSHKSGYVIRWCARQWHNMSYLPALPRSPFVQCMPEIYRGDDPIAAYRRYYNIGRPA